MNIIRKTIHCISAACLALSPISVWCDTPPPTPTKAIDDFVASVAHSAHLNNSQVRSVIQQAHYDPRVIQAMTHPYEKLPWDVYRHFFLNKKRIQDGANYLHAHWATFKTVEKQYGVPPALIAAIIGVETSYGRHQGQFRALDALTTLSFYYPKRAPFFQNELKEYIRFTNEQGLRPTELKSSYAGALGIAQFMPSNYRAFGVDFSHNQHIDLFHNHADAIASVAHFLKQKGWQSHGVVAWPVQVSGSIPSPLISTQAVPDTTIQQFKKIGVVIHRHLSPTKKAALIEMQGTKQPEYWLVFNNFHAIMQYNPRTTYALAVYQLSQAIRTAYDRRFKTATRAPVTPERPTH